MSRQRRIRIVVAMTVVVTLFTLGGAAVVTLRAARVKVFDQVIGNLLAASPAGDVLATHTEDGKIHLWSTESGALVRTLVPLPAYQPEPGSNVTDSIEDIAFSPNGDRVAVARGQKIHIWSVSTGAEVRVLEARGGSPAFEAVQFAPGGDLLAASVVGSIVTLWSSRDGRFLRKFDSGQGIPFSLAFSPDGELVAIAGNDGLVQLRSPLTGTLIRELRGGTDHFKRSIAFSPSGDLLASASSDKVVLWKRDGTPARTFKTDAGFGFTGFSSDGSLVADVNDAKLRLWSVSDGNLVREIAGVSEFAFAPRGNWIAARSQNKPGLRLWPLHPPFGLILGGQ